MITDDPARGQAALSLIALLVAVGIIVLLRKRLLWAILCASTWMLLAAIAIPGFIPARPIAFRNACLNNLHVIQDAKIRWAAESGKPANAVPTEADLYGVKGTNAFLRHRLSCPRGGIYTFGSVAENPKCSLSEQGHRLE